MSISLALILKQYPSLADNEEEILSLNELNLSRLHIHAIDNLELFSHITSLDLSYNSIARLANLNFLLSLKRLNVSFNQIQIISVDELPLNLLHLDISGNSIGDDSILLELKAALPSLEVVTDSLYAESTEGDNQNSKPSETAPASEFDASSSTESVMRSIVARKCFMESIFNESAASELTMPENRATLPLIINDEAAEGLQNLQTFVGRLRAERTPYELADYDQMFASRIKELKKQIMRS